MLISVSLCKIGIKNVVSIITDEVESWAFTYIHIHQYTNTNQMQIMKKNLSINLAVLLAIFFSAWTPALGQMTIIDNFDRATVGSDWSRFHGSDLWAINASEQLVYTGASSSVLYYNAANLDGATSWTLEAGMVWPNVGAYQGLAFNIEATGPSANLPFISGHSFYAVDAAATNNRIRLLKYPGNGNGTPTVLQQTDLTSIPADTNLILRIESSNVGSITYSLFQGETSLFSSTYTDAVSPFSGGFAGYFAGGGGSATWVQSDSFNLEIIPEPSSMAMVMALLAGVFVIVARRKNS